MEATEEGSCAAYYGAAPAALLKRLVFWKTPVARCGFGGRTEELRARFAHARQRTFIEGRRGAKHHFAPARDIGGQHHVGSNGRDEGPAAFGVDVGGSFGRKPALAFLERHVMRDFALPDIELRLLETRRRAPEVFDRERARHALERQHAILAARMTEPEQVIRQRRG